jgi:integrase
VFEDRDRGGWVVLVRYEGGRRKARARTKTEALAKLDAIRADLARVGTAGHGNMTVGDLADEWERKVLGARDHSPKTLDSYRWALRHVRAELGRKRLRTLGPEAIEAAFADLARRGMARSSIGKVRSVLGQVLAFGERRGYVTRNAARIAELPATARRQAPGRALTVEQARVLLAAADQDRLGALWATMLLLGLRPGEATGLAWPDVDLERQVLHVRRSLKFDGNRPVVDDRLKTSRSRRTLDMPAALTERIRAHRSRQAAERLAAGAAWSNEHDLVFTTVTGTPLNPSNLRRAFAQVTDASGLGPGWHPHLLRHSAASLLSAAGVPLERVADVLGHKTSFVTGVVYRHSVSPSVDAAAVAMGEMFPSDLS